MVKVRFAPSPTGYLHIGGARTCLFNWLYVRRLGGKFVLRIEDTDIERSKKEFLDEILESIKWLGLDWDEIHYQSQRFQLYHDYAQKLIDEGKAYKKEGAVFFKYQFSEIKIDDLVRGKIVFTELPKPEEVIIKSDNSPTYNFSCVVDDYLMGINCVIRGEDHISNTPKQILMYKALGFKIPQFAHLPLILSAAGGRLSKRFGATSIREYRDDGYLAEALLNYLLLLGWSPGDNREIISLEEAKKIFDIKKVNKTGAAFSVDKLNWVNSEYIKSKSITDLAKIAAGYLRSKNFLPPDVDTRYIERVVELFKERISKLSDLMAWARFCFYDDYAYGEDAKKVLEKNLNRQVQVLMERFSSMDSFDKDTIEKEFRDVARSLSLKARDLVHPVRVSLTGEKVGPGLFETIEVLGKKRVLKRLERLCKYWAGSKE
ncbi:MAG: glutamate--tRNA ligase [Candidatus Omnitrophota bacterium]|nr:MAG: glutamate--tRNA ligase [Candidatus Omnitrophota bacterium]